MSHTPHGDALAQLEKEYGIGDVIRPDSFQPADPALAPLIQLGHDLSALEASVRGRPSATVIPFPMSEIARDKLRDHALEQQVEAAAHSRDLEDFDFFMEGV